MRSWDNSLTICLLLGWSMAWRVVMVIKDQAFTYIPIGLCNASYMRCILNCFISNPFR